MPYLTEGGSPGSAGDDGSLQSSAALSKWTYVVGGVALLACGAAAVGLMRARALRQQVLATKDGQKDARSDDCGQDEEAGEAGWFDPEQGNRLRQKVSGSPASDSSSNGEDSAAAPSPTPLPSATVPAGPSASLHQPTLALTMPPGAPAGRLHRHTLGTSGSLGSSLQPSAAHPALGSPAPAHHDVGPGPVHHVGPVVTSPAGSERSDSSSGSGSSYGGRGEDQAPLHTPGSADRDLDEAFGVLV